MSDVRAAELLRQLDESADADRDLLARFVRHRDHAAFERLVRRHGPMVLAVCRRVAGHPQDAEDAFQAIFLVLAQKGAGVSDPDLLGNWLYGVAVRVAQKARRTAARRRAREVQVTAMRDPVAAVSAEPDDTGPILHEELARLPAVFRDAIVLCDLRGLSRAEAAGALGVPEGTLSSRLANGRKKLADRLARRGVALSAAAIPAAVSEARATPVPESLITKTCGLAADAAAGGLVAGEVARLAKGGTDVRRMLAASVLGAALAAAGVVFAARPDADPQKKTNPPKKADPPAAKVEPADPVAGVKFTSSPRLVDRHDVKLTGVRSLHWNRAGTRLVVSGIELALNRGGEYQNMPAMHVLTRQPWGVQAIPNTGRQLLVGFAPDGERVLTEEREFELLSGHHRLYTWKITDPPAGAPFIGGGPVGVPVPSFQMQKTLNLPPDRTTGYAFSADGKTFRTVVVEKDVAGDESVFSLRVVNALTGEVVKTDEGRVAKACAMSPDGKRLAFVMSDYSVLVSEVGKNDARINQIPRPDPQFVPPTSPVHVAFSPDGKRVVVSSGYNWTHVLNADNIDLLPPLEGLLQSETQPAHHAFTFDGRLVALAGSRWIVRKGRTRGGEEAVTSVTRGAQFVGVWDTQTGKALKVWERDAKVAFSPTAPVLATLEKNGTDQTRLGLWNFAAEE